MNDRLHDHGHPEVPAGVHAQKPEDREKMRANPRWVGGYLAPVAVVLFTIFWVLLAYWLIGWRVRDWQFGTVPYVPAESRYTTQQPPRGPVPKQVQLPPRPKGAQNARP